MFKKAFLTVAIVSMLLWAGSAVLIHAEDLSGTITIAGSTSVQPLSDELAKAFMAKHPNVKVLVQGGGSGAGIKAAQTGTADIGSSSRELEANEKGLNEIQIATDGIAIIVHPSNKDVNNLTIDQLKGIFSGKLTNWEQVGGKSLKIIVVNREDGSGTRGAFVDLVMGKNNPLTSDCLVQASTGAVRSTVAITPEAVGYISMGFVDSTIRPVKVEGFFANEENIKTKSYKIARPFLYLTKEKPAGLVKAYLDFVLSADGQKIVAKEYLPVTNVK